MPRQTPVLAALSAPLVAGDEPVQLTPDGVFRAVDGRPQGIDGWRMDAAIAERVIARLGERRTRMVVNYEHPEPRGEPLPAAGWIDRSRVTYQPGVGLVALVDWTARAKAMIEAGEYAYLSPVIAYDAKSGEVVDLVYAGLTNTPALDGMAAIAALAERLGYGAEGRCAERPSHLDPRPSQLSPHEDTDMELAALRSLLTLGEDADEAAVTRAINDLKTKADEVAPLTEQVAALTERADAAPDPKDFVPLAVHQEAMAALRMQNEQGQAAELARLIEEGLDAGKIPGPATAQWLRARGLAACREYLGEAPALAALTRTQTGGAPPDGATEQKDEFTAALKEEFGSREAWEAYRAAEASGLVKIYGGEQ